MKATIVAFVFVLVMATAVASDSKRFRRFLIFPAASPTRMQLIAGVGLPVDLEYESVTIGYVLKSEYFLPDNISIVDQFLRDPFDPLTRPLERRRRSAALRIASKNRNGTSESTRNGTQQDDNYEKYDVEAVQIGTGLMNADDGVANVKDSHYSDEWNGIEDGQDEGYMPAEYRITKQNDFQTARWTLYRGIEAMANRKGLTGRACMLRSICESAHAPFSFRSGIVAEILHILLTPSSSQDTMTDHSLNEYYRAEEIGKSGAPCDKVFRECPISVVDTFSGIYSTMESVVKMIG